MGIPSRNIVVGGFSMGGSPALHVGFRNRPQIGGIFALSSFLNTDSEVYRTLEESEIKPPVFMCHGNKDPLVDYEWGKDTHDKLVELGVSTEFHEYEDMFHELKLKELETLAQWIGDIVQE